MDMKKIMQQAREIQKKIAAAQEENAAKEYEGTSGGGLVKITIKGSGEIIFLNIDDSIISVNEKSILSDLIIAAHNDARRKAEAGSQENIDSLGAGLGLPPGFKLPF
jgi:hypothetical protein